MSIETSGKFKDKSFHSGLYGGRERRMKNNYFGRFRGALTLRFQKPSPMFLTL